MRIPLDYYQILSVPIQAAEQQIEQAYQDRLLQEPRREYNQYAIKSRQALIDRAYEVLANSETRAEYDAQFLVNMQPVAPLEVLEQQEENPEIAENEVLESESATETTTATLPPVSHTPAVNPTIEVPSFQLVGALLILHNLGEYELVLTQGIEYYNSQEFSRFQQRVEEEEATATQENIILALAIAYMELGREQWHRQEYETAAVSSQLGIDLLEQENLFPQVREELELDLCKLRPYRILELISCNSAGSAPRALGFQLLRDMLAQRKGIEGKGDDLSGLSFDRFLCFIQQLRTYLTSGEQQQLFDTPNQEESPIANYLAVYALFARGFAHKQPELILKARRKLEYLSEKQDVTWEQAVCSLLLGHTEKAIAKVHQTQDTAKLNQILQHAPDRIDLLPGMCLSSEQWLREDVLSQFVDLSSVELTLKEYFADREVQKYLNQLTSSTVLVTAESTSVPTTPSSKLNDSTTGGIGILSRWRNIFNDTTASNTIVSTNQVINTKPRLNQTTTIEPQDPSHRVYHNHQQRKAKIKSKATPPRHSQKQAKPSISLPLESPKRAVPPSVFYKSQAKHKKPKSKTKISIRTKGWLFIFSLILGVGTLGFIATKLFLNPSQQTAKVQLAIALHDPTVEIPPVKPVVAKPKLTLEQKSQLAIERWLNSKSAAFGKEHQITKLNDALAEPLLTTWRDRATSYQQGNFYREYQHQITMRSAKLNPNNPKQATVEAEVKETAQHYQSGQLDNSKSYDDNLLVRYQLILRNGKWLIKNAEVLKTL